MFLDVRETRLMRASDLPSWGACFLLTFSVISIQYSCWLGCCLIPFYIQSCKDILHLCPYCGSAVGKYNRLCWAHDFIYYLCKVIQTITNKKWMPLYMYKYAIECWASHSYIVNSINFKAAVIDMKLFGLNVPSCESYIYRLQNVSHFQRRRLATN